MWWSSTGKEPMQPADILRQLIRHHMNNGTSDPRAIAEDIIALNPDTYHQFLTDEGPQLFTDWVTQATRVIRWHERSRSNLNDINQRIKEGDTTAISLFNVLIKIEGQYKPLGDMTREDHLTVADQYREAAHQNDFYATQHEKIASEMKPGETTKDAFNEISIRNLYRAYEGE